MRYIILTLLLSAISATHADVIKKWVDEKGVVHYGDRRASDEAKDAETVRIKDTFDEEAYQEGLRRHEETEALVNEYEEERLAEEKQKREQEEAEKASRPSAPGGAYRKPPPRPTPEEAEPAAEPATE
jgi:hypothetical protein